MNYYQERKLSMFWSMVQFLVSTSPEILQQIPNFEVLFANFQAKVNELNAIASRQVLQRDGNIIEKSIVREELCVMGASIAAKIYAYATNVSNYQLRSAVNYSKSSLLKTADTKCIAVCTIIAEMCSEYLVALAPYNISANTLSDFEKLIALYDSTVLKPKQGVVAKKAATAAFRKEMKEATVLLNTMQLLTKVVEENEYVFVVDFNNTKRMNEPAYKTLSAQGKVVDTAGVAVPLVTMSCEFLGIERRVTKNGGFRLKNMPDGIHIFVFSRAGYETKTVELIFYRSVRFEITVVLELAKEIE